MKLSKNFKLSEFTKSYTAIAEGIENELPFNGEDLNVKKLVINLLQPVRSIFGRMDITSGYRSPALNARLKGSKNSHHLKAMAADIIFGDSYPVDVFEWFKTNPNSLKWTQIIYYPKKNFIHFSYDENDLRNQLLIK